MIKSKIIIFAWLCALPYVSERALAAIPARLDLRSAADVCGVLLSLSNVHPSLVGRMISENIEVAHTLAGIKEVPVALRQAALARSPDFTSLTGIEYVLADSWQLPGMDIAPMVDKLPSIALEDILTDAHNIREKKELLAYFTLGPFLYDEKGLPNCAQIDDACKDRLKKTLALLSVLELRDRLGFNRFERSFRGELNPTLMKIAEAVQSHSSGLARQTFQSFRNHFIQRGINEFVPDRAKLQSLFIEEMHPLVALYRSFFAADSQTKRSSLFVLLDSVRAFKINSIEGGQIRPLGHLLVVEIELSNEKIPFLIGINGVLVTEEVVPSVMQLLSVRYGRNQVLVPDYSTYDRLTDQDSVRNAFQKVASIPIRIELGSGWREIRKILQARDPVTEHENALFADIASANLIDTSQAFPIDTRRLLTPPREYSVPSPYQRDIQPTDVDRAVRSVLFQQIRKAFPEFDEDEIKQLLRL
jgi:hypothetical protein